MRSVQELNPVNRERDGGEILFHLSLQKIGGDRDIRERARFYVGRTERVNATAVRNRRSMGLSKSIGLDPINFPSVLLSSLSC